MKYLVETNDKTYTVYAEYYYIEGNYIDFKNNYGLFSRSVAYFRTNDVVRIIGKEENENKYKQISEGEEEPKW